METDIKLKIPIIWKEKMRKRATENGQTLSSYIRYLIQEDIRKSEEPRW